MYSLILPRVKSNRWHHSPRYLILDKFLEHLKEEEFSGFSEINGTYNFVLFFLNGDPVQGFRIIEDQLYTYSALPEKLPHLELDELIMYPTPPAFVTGIMDSTHGLPLQKDSNTSFDSLKPVITDLESAKFQGTITIQWDSTEGFIIFQGGIPENSFVVTSSTIIEGKDALQDILIRVKEKKGLITVYTRKTPENTPGSDRVLYIKKDVTDTITSAFGKLGAEVVNAAKEKNLLKDIAQNLCVDPKEIEPVYSYMVEKGYAELKKRDTLEEKTRKFWNEL
ncbi:MAG: hypothetical protein PVF58_05350 [Candidatus Methanofastidiosia archaeon]|jgi:hypothetical protein